MCQIKGCEYFVLLIILLSYFQFSQTQSSKTANNTRSATAVGFELRVIYGNYFIHLFESLLNL